MMVQIVSSFTISPTFYLDSNGVTVKCRGCNPGDQGIVNGVIYTAHDNTSITAKSKSDTDWSRGSNYSSY